MTKEEIIRMAREAISTDDVATVLHHFAALVAAAEREACAKLADSMDSLQDGAIGAAIRARGTP